MMQLRRMFSLYKLASISTGNLVILLLGFYYGGASAQSSEDFWVLAYPEPPFVEQTDKGKLTGFLVDEVNGILTTAGIHQQILLAPWKRLEQEAKIKANVLAFALTRTAESEQNYHWITPLTANVYSVYSSQKLASPLNNLEQLSEFDSIAVLENDVRHKILQAQNAKNIHAYTSWSEAIDSVVNEHSSAIFFSDAGMQYFCRVQGKGCSQLERVFMYEETVTYLTLSKLESSPELVNRLKNAAKQYKQSDAFKRISKYWLKQYENLPIPMHMEEGVLNLWNK
ncbi:transporter substrate-binding domain-containing protein [Aliiglaciecola sp. 3_MG-2023]|uniref:substrate-binding periplasmic protein n=1 Tax=Aliiglaciecola sp. 3_MG-2023 TaxID=3062644 RepID=UPI0026E2DD61|nr:transporter substrate-binding domain-containing protein [Aliiglaciecola sp. 3_MG-2023]MDO6694915.1 transporter substrate-binding domain-containing protein [Aliiglaciecola sp. 3_MG-2023]